MRISKHSYNVGPLVHLENNGTYIYFFNGREVIIIIIIIIIHA